MNITDIEKLIKHNIAKELNIDIKQIDRLLVISIFNFPKNDYHSLERYPIVDKGIILVETEYYINEVGYRRIYAIEKETNRFMDINQDTLELILKTNKRINETEEDISHLDFFKADNRNITCQKVSIECDSEEEKETIKKIGKSKPCDYTLPSRRRAEILAKKLGH